MDKDVAVENTVVHGGLLAAPDPDGGLGAFVLALRYKACSAVIKADFNTLYQAMNGMDLREMDQILDPVCTRCRAHERAGFLAGVRAESSSGFRRTGNMGKKDSVTCGKNVYFQNIRHMKKL